MEIRPWNICKIKLCICQLPEKEIRQSQLAACTDHQVRIRIPPYQDNSQRRPHRSHPDPDGPAPHLRQVSLLRAESRPCCRNSAQSGRTARYNLWKSPPAFVFYPDILVKSRYVSDHFYPPFCSSQHFSYISSDSCGTASSGRPLLPGIFSSSQWKKRKL